MSNFYLKLIITLNNILHYFFNNVVYYIELLLKDNYGNLCVKYDNKIIAIFSKSFAKKLSKYSGNKYQASIDYIVLWHDKQNSKYIKHPLCKIVLTHK